MDHAALRSVKKKNLFFAALTCAKSQRSRDRVVRIGEAAMAGTLATRRVGYRGISAAFTSFEIARELDHSLCAGKNPAPFVGSGLPKTHAERAPMADADVNRRGEVNPTDDSDAAHVDTL